MRVGVSACTEDRLEPSCGFQGVGLHCSQDICHSTPLFQPLQGWGRVSGSQAPDSWVWLRQGITCLLHPTGALLTIATLLCRYSLPGRQQGRRSRSPSPAREAQQRPRSARTAGLDAAKAKETAPTFILPAKPVCKATRQSAHMLRPLSRAQASAAGRGLGVEASPAEPCGV